jgi:hypothetical protein
VVGELGGRSAAPQCEPLRDGGLIAWSANLGRNNANRCPLEDGRWGRVVGREGAER